MIKQFQSLSITVNQTDLGQPGIDRPDRCKISPRQEFAHYRCDRRAIGDA